MLHPVRSAVFIAAPPEQVFGVLLDVDSYPRWNPFTPWVSMRTAEVAPGVEFDLHCQMTPTQLLEHEHEVVLSLDRQRLEFSMGTSRTRGRPGVRSWRRQRCHPVKGGTLLTNDERFAGPLAPLVYLLYRRRLRRAFVRYCGAVRRHVEALG